MNLMRFCQKQSLNDLPDINDKIGKMTMQRKDITPLISIIVPAYNEEKYIGKCLSSLKDQSYPEKKIEIIFVDDGSKDHTKDIAAQFADLVLTQTHQGPDVARNLGAAKAKGEILIFIDADMYVDKEYVKNIINPITENQQDATFTKEEHIANPSNIWSRCYQIDNHLPTDSRIRLSQKNTDIRFRAILKTIFISLGGFIPDIGYDGDRTVQLVKSVSAAHAVCYHYNPDSLRDVYFSARWVGRSQQQKAKWKNILRYSIVNSCVISVKNICHGAPVAFFLYKIVFDLGFLSGLLRKNSYLNYSK
jgi:glycosyltransferase involved in cell wall biosynthesis